MGARAAQGGVAAMAADARNSALCALAGVGGCPVNAGVSIRDRFCIFGNKCTRLQVTFGPENSVA